MDRVSEHAWGIVAGLVVIVATGWMVVARTSWIAALVGLSISVIVGLAALASIEPDEDSEISATADPARSPKGVAKPERNEPTWVTGTRLHPSR